MIAAGTEEAMDAVDGCTEARRPTPPPEPLKMGSTGTPVNESPSNRSSCSLVTSLFPTICRSRAEAFARRLHRRLTSLGTENPAQTWHHDSSIKSDDILDQQPRRTSEDNFTNPEEENLKNPKKENFTNSGIENFTNTGIENFTNSGKENSRNPKKENFTNREEENYFIDPEDGFVSPAEAATASEISGLLINSRSLDPDGTESDIIFASPKASPPSDCSEIYFDLSQSQDEKPENYFDPLTDPLTDTSESNLSNRENEKRIIGNHRFCLNLENEESSSRESLWSTFEDSSTLSLEEEEEVQLRTSFNSNKSDKSESIIKSDSDPIIKSDTDSTMKSGFSRNGKKIRINEEGSNSIIKSDSSFSPGEMMKIRMNDDEGSENKMLKIKEKSRDGMGMNNEKSGGLESSKVNVDKGSKSNDLTFGVNNEKSEGRINNKESMNEILKIDEGGIEIDSGNRKIKIDNKESQNGTLKINEKSIGETEMEINSGFSPGNSKIIINNEGSEDKVLRGINEKSRNEIEIDSGFSPSDSKIRINNEEGSRKKNEIVEMNSGKSEGLSTNKIQINNKESNNNNNNNSTLKINNDKKSEELNTTEINNKDSPNEEILKIAEKSIDKTETGIINNPSTLQINNATNKRSEEDSPSPFDDEDGKMCLLLEKLASSPRVTEGRRMSRDREKEKEEEEEEINGENEEDGEGRIPKIRRSSSLKTGKTPPGTPGRKKIVRFADVLGLDLADVRTFLDEIPKVPNSAYRDLSYDEIFRKDASPDPPRAPASSYDFRKDASPIHSFIPRRKPDRTLVPLFDQPGGSPAFLELVKHRKVCLENVLVHDPVALSVRGTVRVVNLDFHKSVHVRYTLNRWANFSDLSATYVANSCDGFTDKFSFLLDCHTLPAGQRLEFAVRYHCKGEQYWDNNDGENYCFQCLPLAGREQEGQKWFY